MTIGPLAEDEEDDLYDDLLGEDDEWEDQKAYEEILEKMPNGWYMIKIINFNHQKLIEIDEWCSNNMTGRYERIGWRSGCAYSVAMQLEDSRDAVLFKLMWSS